MYEVPFLSMAMELATRLHQHQKRKYTGEPYIRHPFAVAGLVMSALPRDEEAVVAALLHDVVEDTTYTVKNIRGLFGHKVADLVHDVTDLSIAEDGTREVRKAIDIAHLSRGSAIAKTIKLADIIDNLSSIMHYDPRFAKIYLREKRATLKVLHEGDRVLFRTATEIVEGYFDGQGH